MKITAIILTYNESLHIDRCIKNILPIVDKVLVVDSNSSDNTINIAQNLGARILKNNWTNYATQFNWALSQLDSDTEWVLRIDADEILSDDLINDIKIRSNNIPSDVDGIYFCRRMKFQGKVIKHGGVFPVKVVRLFRYGKGFCENRWMDEHIKLSGESIGFSGELIDDNLNNLTWWTEKHNSYSSREVVDLLNLKYKFMIHESVANIRSGDQAGFKRWIKEHIYSEIPRGYRSALYFFYRYVLRFGFLDGYQGFSFHFLQGFWYRYLVDAKLHEVESYMINNGVDAKAAIKKILNIGV